MATTKTAQVGVAKEVVASAREFLNDSLAAERHMTMHIRAQCNQLLDWLIGDFSFGGGSAFAVDRDITAYYAKMVCKCLRLAQMDWPLDATVAERLTRIELSTRGADTTKH